MTKKASGIYAPDSLSRIDVDINLGKLANLLRDRILVVFKKHGLEPTHEGWQELALKYMLKHEPEMKVKPGQLDVSPHLREFATISLQSWNGKNASVYSVAKKLYGKRAGDTLRTRYSENKKRRNERTTAGLPQHPRDHFNAALTLALLAIGKAIKNK